MEEIRYNGKIVVSTGKLARLIQELAYQIWEARTKVTPEDDWNATGDYGARNPGLAEFWHREAAYYRWLNRTRQANTAEHHWNRALFEIGGHYISVD